ncbi:PTS system IIA component (Fru family) [Vibrio crassostreae]|uniref:fructose PTS transporter subunit IIA n=1 Tax=Vibrio crassostreae TaxID=246167 RepID=UPI00104CF0BE|nr:fructose PTS transporter subunit IIA [Vibrio crassostreae]TCN90868.1 PTS system IIA component (Fru family) [Vibrio crassostreae]CAK2428363.1 PTS system IIA component (Fru family) [Vibrio crassostreae]CAK2489785.1 PTS system IIA component (Fru family) [Vibrio crassostreae]CAK3671570.1 PTS system IIA component (Fru family) [Vibrio crassostreae]CAK3821809.1 PTS system IIA component (Fru family) [Vibrio crassostreae]
MKITDLIHKESISIGNSFSEPLEVIEFLTDKLVVSGQIRNRAEFVSAVLAREEEGPTALGESLAVPHGKSDAVITPCVAIAVTNTAIKWTGIDEGEKEDVEIVVLLGIPLAHQGDTHIALLSELTSLLIDDEFRELIKRSSTPEMLVEIIKQKSE